MAWRGERPAAWLRLPLPPARGASGRGRERFDPQVSVRSRERDASAAGRLTRSQDLESGDSTTVVTCVASALPPASGFRLRRLPRNSEDVVIPFPLPSPMLARHGCQRNKVCPNRATNAQRRNLTK